MRKIVPWLLAGGLGVGAWVYRDRLPLPGAETPAAPEPTPKAHAKKKGAHKAKGSTLSGASSGEARTLVPPEPKPCLAGPSEADAPEEGMISSQGLGDADVASAMSGVVSYALPCFADAPTGEVLFQVTAGCDGRVASLKVQDDGGYPTDVVGCVAEILRAASFPAHDLPDGYSFLYPVRYQAP